MLVFLFKSLRMPQAIPLSLFKGQTWSVWVPWACINTKVKVTCSFLVSNLALFRWKSSAPAPLASAVTLHLCHLILRPPLSHYQRGVGWQRPEMAKNCATKSWNILTCGNLGSLGNLWEVEESPIQIIFELSVAVSSYFQPIAWWWDGWEGGGHSSK